MPVDARIPLQAAQNVPAPPDALGMAAQATSIMANRENIQNSRTQRQMLEEATKLDIQQKKTQAFAQALQGPLAAYDDFLSKGVDPEKARQQVQPLWMRSLINLKQSGMAPPDQLQAVMDFNPDEARMTLQGTLKYSDLLEQQRKSREGFTLSPGSQRFGPDGKLIASVPREPAQRNIQYEEFPVGNDQWQKYRINPDGSKVPEGPAYKKSADAAADRKLAAGKPQANLRFGAVTQTLDRLETAMDELYKDPGLPNITGSIAGRTPNISNTATGAQTKLDSITSQLFVNALQAMREASKTGGAVGNVSDREGDKLERTIAALGQSQSTESFREQLAKAIDQMRLSKELIRRAYEDQYGESPPEQPGITPYVPGSPQPSAPAQSGGIKFLGFEPSQ